MNYLSTTVDAELVKALAWCRIGGMQFRPKSDDAFRRAQAIGLLAHDPTWRATERGEGVLVALGLLNGKPEPERLLATMLWARRSADSPQAQFVAAWAEGLDDAWPETAAKLRSAVEREFAAFGDARGGGNVSRPATQLERVIKASKSYRGITQVDFLGTHTIDGGPPITRVAARIQDARDQGHEFESLGTRQGCKVYRWVSGPAIEAGGNVSERRAASSRGSGPAPAEASQAGADVPPSLDPEPLFDVRPVTSAYRPEAA